MSESRPSSFAKSVDAGEHEPNSLDQQTPARAHFNAAAYDDMALELETEHQGSEQIEQDRPTPQPRPTPEFAQDVDRDMHAEAVARDHQAAKEHNEKLSDDYERVLDEMESENKYRENLENNIEYVNER